MNSTASFFVYILIAALPLPVFWVVFRMRLSSVLLGVPAIFLALVGEEFLQTYLDPTASFMILFIAPVIEESSKFLMTVWKRDFRAGVGVGMGFAILENALYYMSYPYLLSFFLMAREIQDPALHMTTTSISANRGWRKIRYLGIAMFLHFAYNLVSLSNSPAYIGIVAAIYIGIMVVQKIRINTGNQGNKKNGRNKKRDKKFHKMDKMGRKPDEKIGESLESPLPGYVDLHAASSPEVHYEDDSDDHDDDPDPDVFKDVDDTG